jgi:hypothetical protein
MPDIPEEAVQAAARAMVTIYQGFQADGATSVDEEAARAALEAVESAGLVVVAAAVRDEELERLRLIAKVNYGLYRSAHEEAEIAAATVARVRRLRDVYEVNARTMEGVAGRNFFELFVEELDAVLDPSSLPPETPAQPEEEMADG